MDIVHLAILKVLTLLLSVSCTLNVITCNMIMAYDVNPARKGRAAGWREASNLGGIGGGVALMLAQREGVIVPAVVILVISAVFAVFLGFVTPRPAEYIARWPVERFVLIGRDVWALLRSRAGWLTILLMLAPIGSGAAGNLFITFGKPFHVGADAMALVNGMFGGLASIAGALIAGWACDRMDRMIAFCVFGLLLAVVAVAMAAAPRTPADFIGFALVYSLATGCCYGAFAAAILDVAGQTATATRMGLLTCLTNVPIMLMSLLEGRFGELHGVTSVLLVDAATGAVPAVLFLAVIGSLRWWGARPDLVPASV